ncbi:tetratricopeptide repeat protein [Glycomyces sp. A-F 0318]|uniref:ATP-binding protein n=1 Tax=Glycomyces amatae TaxID=2881355 RepID=UPI001E657B49|nr:XRE family transcriptional regulator [Glycomyces amatae]MCD0444089.1 tetratricopeptide repeat protein [Glycomyces amatae]
MGRPEQPIDPRQGPLEQFAQRLRELRAAAPEDRTYRAMAARAHYSASTLARAASGREVPSLEVTVAYAAACGADPETWARRWHRLQHDLAGAPAPAPAPAPLPYQLPADLPDFAGRAKETEWLLETTLARLDEADRSSPTVLGVTGGPGVGKTALAVHLAHRLAPEYADGQLFINMRGFDERRLSPESVLRQCVRALGHPDERVPADPDELACAYRSLLRHRRCLLVFDNAREEADLRPLLPGAPGCLVLATSRNNLIGLEGARTLKLEPFSAAESLELLGRIAGTGRVAAEPAAAAELAEQCGHYPLALRIAGARLASRPQWKVTTLTERLRDEARRLAELEAGDLRLMEAFSMSYRALEDAERLLFRRLGALFPGVDFGPAVAARLAGIGEGEAELRLETLVDANLLESSGPSRYQMHDLLRLYAATRWVAEDEPDDAARRLLAWYTGTAAAATRLLMPDWFALDVPALPDAPMSNAREALEWYERERHNIAALVRFASETGEDALSWRLAYAAGGFFVLLRHWQSYAATGETALAAARRAGDRAVAAALAVNLAAAYTELRRSRDAIDLLRDAAAFYEEAGDATGLVQALGGLSHACVVHDRVGEALEHARRAYDIAERAGDAWGEGGSLCAIGRAYIAQGRFEMALKMFQAALDRSEVIGNRWAQMRSLQVIAETCREMDDHGRAMAAYGKALGLAAEIGDQLSEGRFRYRIGNLRFDLGEIADARAEWHEAEAVLAAVGDPLVTAVRGRLELTEPLTAPRGGRPIGRAARS